MPYAKATFNDLLLSMSYRYGESTVPASGIDNRKYWINRGIEFCAEQLELVTAVSVTVAANVCALNETTASPAYDFKSINELRNSDDRSFTIVTKDVYPVKVGQYCCITGSHSTGFVLNVKEDGVFTLWYRFYTSPLVATTDVCIISDPEAVAAYAYAQIRMSETDPLEDAEKNMQECRDRIAAMAKNIGRSEGDLTFKTLY